jgi:hypothetical protein
MRVWNCVQKKNDCIFGLEVMRTEEYLNLDKKLMAEINRIASKQYEEHLFFVFKRDDI